MQDDELQVRWQDPPRPCPPVASRGEGGREHDTETDTKTKTHKAHQKEQKKAKTTFTHILSPRFMTERTDRISYVGC